MPAPFPFNISNKLSFRLFSSIFVVIISIGVSIYIFLLKPLATVIEEITHKSFYEHTLQIQNICENQYADLLRSGRDENSPQARIHKGITLGLLEEYMTSHDLLVIVTNSDQFLMAPENFSDPDILTTLREQPMSSFSLLKIYQKEFYTTRGSFSPWQWDIYLLLDAAQLQQQISHLRQSYVVAFIFLIIGTLLIFYLLLRQIQSPIYQIISALRKGGKPTYQGIAELEFLSKNLSEALTQKEQKSVELEEINKNLAREVKTRQQKEAELVESEKKYRLLIETTNTGFVIQDGLGTVFDANQVYLKMTGRQNRDQVIGHKVSEWIADHDQWKYVEQIKKCLASQPIRNLEIDYVKPDGTVLPVEMNARVIHEQGSTRIISLLHDVSERRQNTLEREKLINDLHRAEYEIQREKMHNKVLAQSKLASLGQLATGVAHEINQPLTFIRMMLHALLRDLQNHQLNADKLAHNSHYSLQQISRITEIISHLRTFGRDDETKFCDIDLKEVVRNTLILMGQRLTLKNIAFHQNIQTELPLVRGNVNQLEQVLINLFQNSIDALQDKQHKSLTIAIDSDESQVNIRVTDNGGGIPAHVQERVFEPFFTTKDQGEGTGIGLSIVYGIIKKHHGDIRYVSVPDGACFHITLPVS